jgi:hypothetical protein
MTKFVVAVLLAACVQSALAAECQTPRHVDHTDADPQIVFGLSTATSIYIAGGDAAALQAYDEWFSLVLASGETGDEDTILGFLLYGDLLCESAPRIDPSGTS